MAVGRAVEAGDQPQRCFVVMGFGTKTDLATGRKIDLDKSYKYLIKPVVESRGIACLRADEIIHSGTIDVPMYRELLTADFVIADISTANPNAIYELGVRHALRPCTTIVMSENQLKYPFDLNHILIAGYTYLDGGGIDFDEVMRFRDLLGKKLDELRQTPTIDSPVYTFLNDLRPPSQARQVVDAVTAAGEAVTAAGEAIADAGPAMASAPMPAGPTLSELVEHGEQAIERGDFAIARDCFRDAIAAYGAMQAPGAATPRDDPYLIQHLALTTYKAGQPSAVGALTDALALLAPLRPDDSNDPETLTLAGSIEKRLYEEGQGAAHLGNAFRYYSRGYYLRNDYHHGINLANLQSARAGTELDPKDGEKAADLVIANRLRREVLALCDREIEATARSRRAARRDEVGDGPWGDALRENQAKAEWMRLYRCLAAKAQAHFGLGEMGDYEATRRRALAIDPPPPGWRIASLDAQIAKLRAVLERHGHLLDPPWPASPSPTDPGP